MRIVAGEARGRRLIAPAGRLTRPTSDRVREALFSVLGSRVSGSRVLDPFAGSGALGLEALSRGARLAVFVERDPGALRALRRNVEALGWRDRSRIESGDALAALGRLASEGIRFDLVFLDPPYRGDLLDRALAALAAGPLLAPGAVVVAEHARSTPPAIPASLEIVDSRRWGDTAVALIASRGPRAASGEAGKPVANGKSPPEMP